MSVEAQTNATQEQKPNDKELNFRALEAKYQRQLEQERLEKEQIKRELEEQRNRSVRHDDEEEDDSEPYVDKKRLKKEQAKLGQQIKQETQADIQKAVQTALHEDRKRVWIESNPDFYDVLQKHAEKLAEKAPKLAESILNMPDGFERQKLVYNNIKALGIDRPETKGPSIQDKIESNRRSPYYQPSGVGTAPYASAGDFSEVGQKSAFNKMQELKKNLRL